MLAASEGRGRRAGQRPNVLVGVISDTHGLLRPEAVEALRGVDWLIHAGDVGKESILTQLAAIAPVTAIRGNVDRGEWAKRLPPTETLQNTDGLVHIIHDANDLDLNPNAASIRLVISGHSHQPSIRDACRRALPESRQRRLRAGSSCR